jgi:hypothetical protein
MIRVTCYYKIVYVVLNPGHFLNFTASFHEILRKIKITSFIYLQFLFDKKIQYKLTIRFFYFNPPELKQTLYREPWLVIPEI